MFNLDAIEEEILQSLKDVDIVCAHILNIYVYGSCSQGIYSDKSDIDLLVIIPFLAEEFGEEIHLSLKNNINARIMDTDIFLDKLYNYQDVVYQESFFCLFILKETIKMDFKMTEEDYPELRKLISYTSSNSWIEAFKEIQQGAVYLGQKSLFN